MVTQNYNTGIVRSHDPHANKKKRYTKEQVAKIVKQRQERDSELITGMFQNLQRPGEPIRFGLSLYPDEPLTVYELWDGQVYRLPRGVWKHLATNCKLPQYKRLRQDELGSPDIIAGANSNGQLGSNMTITHYNYRFGFKSLEFMSDDEDIQPSKISTVEYDKPQLSGK